MMLLNKRLLCWFFAAVALATNVHGQPQGDYVSLEEATESSSSALLKKRRRTLRGQKQEPDEKRRGYEPVQRKQSRKQRKVRSLMDQNDDKQAVRYCKSSKSSSKASDDFSMPLEVMARSGSKKLRKKYHTGREVPDDEETQGTDRVLRKLIEDRRRHRKVRSLDEFDDDTDCIPKRSSKASDDFSMPLEVRTRAGFSSKKLWKKYNTGRKAPNGEQPTNAAATKVLLKKNYAGRKVPDSGQTRREMLRTLAEGRTQPKAVVALKKLGEQEATSLMLNEEPEENEEEEISADMIPGVDQLEHLTDLQAFRRDAFLKHTLTDSNSFEIKPFMFGRNASSVSIDVGLISVATQFSYNEVKLRRLVDLASRWAGYISAVVYIDDRNHQEGLVESTIRQVGDFYSAHSSTFERVSIHFVVDRRLVNREDYYPHNFLRNQAIDYAWTDAIALLDVDFIPSSGSHDQLLKHLEQMDITNKKTLLILPAFEKQLLAGQTETEMGYMDLPPTKQELLGEPDSTIRPFHEHYYPGHGPTDFARWYQADATYQINYDLYFEPYFVIHRSKDLPLFWEHFSGFGRNKQSWVEELALADYQFYVNPDAFLIHINHGYATQDARFPRPFVMREYAGPFQEYLQETYDYTYWTKDMLQEDLEKTTNTFYRKMLHVCRSPSLFLNQTNTNVDAVVDIPYQCKGDEYREFGHQLFEFVKTGGMESPEAGMRRFPMPANSSALVLGNSHTQQVVQALICQYFDVVEDVSYDDLSGLFEVKFQNGAMLVNMAESSVPYRAKGWRELLEVLVRRSLESFDAIVVGKFDMANSKNEKTIQYGLKAALDKYFDTTKESRQASEGEYVALRYPKISDVATVYPGPMAVVSPFSTTSNSGLRTSQNEQHAFFLEKKTGNQVVEMVDARKYVPELGECGNYKPDGRRRCDQTTSRTITPDKMNRCVGKYGGHPDLIAWDVIEFFHREIVIA